MGLSVGDFADLAGINRLTQTRYESGTSYPNVAYLHAISTHVDTTFVLTGVASANLIPMQEAPAFSQAIDIVDGLAKAHNFKAPAEFRMRAISWVYRRNDGPDGPTPTFEDLLTHCLPPGPSR